MERLSELRYELSTDKPIRLITDSGEDAYMWNEYCNDMLARIGQENMTWFKGPWLFTECYLYRRIREAMLLCKSSLREYDPFEFSKKESHELNLKSVYQLINGLCPYNYAEEQNDPDLLQRRFQISVEVRESINKKFIVLSTNFIQVNNKKALLWANKNDLSLSSGSDVSSKTHNLIEILDSFKDKILCDHTESLWDYLQKLKTKKGKLLRRIDIFLDNCSIELAADLIFCDLLLRNDFVDEIKLHGKAYSWFISDVTKDDFDTLIRQIKSSNSIALNNFYKRISQYQSENKLTVDFYNPFWTSPYSFDRMHQIVPNFYADLNKNSQLVVLKGDLNYRKLIGDLDWPFDTPLKTAVRGFLPASLLAVRTLKSDCVANLDTDLNRNERFAAVAKEFEIGKKKWMITGDFGLIQFLKIDK